MQIMTILGSPRRQGNTAKILGWIEEQFRADGHEVDRANILDYRVQGCGECMACKKGTSELCSIGDDANGLYRRMVAADLVLIAAPVFCWGFRLPSLNAAGSARAFLARDSRKRLTPAPVPADNCCSSPLPSCFKEPRHETWRMPVVSVLGRGSGGRGCPQRCVVRRQTI
jgi:hypothetical protein